MKLSELTEKLGLRNLTPELANALESEISQGFSGDLLSDVLANAPKGGVLVTIQVHINVIAVSSHAGLKAVIFASGRVPEEPVRLRAVEEEIALFAADECAFDISGKLYEYGVRGKKK